MATPAVFERRCAGAGCYLAAVELVEQVARVIGDQIDHLQVERLFVGDVGALAHGRLGPVGVAPALVGDAADVGDGVVGDFGIHLTLDVCA